MGQGETCRGRGFPCHSYMGRAKSCPYVVSAALMFLLLFPSVIFSQSDSSYQQGVAQYSRNQFDSAITSFTNLIEVHPEKKEGYYNRGLSYYRQGKFADALHDFNQCLQKDSVFNDARFMQVLSLQGLGHWDGAYIEFKRLNTNYTGYNELEKRIRYHNLSVILSRNWYYMIAIMFMFIILVGVVAKSYYLIKG